MPASVRVGVGSRSRIWVAPSNATWWRVIGKPINSNVGSSAACRRTSFFALRHGEPRQVKKPRQDKPVACA